MNRNAILGLALVTAAAWTICLFATVNIGALEALLGKAVWYVPYGIAVIGVNCLRRARF